MSQANLRLVEGTSVDKTRALDAPLSKLELAFGKDSIMWLVLDVLRRALEAAGVEFNGDRGSG
jgi:hypothetical protein